MVCLKNLFRKILTDKSLTTVVGSHSKEKERKTVCVLEKM